MDVSDHPDYVSIHVSEDELAIFPEETPLVTVITTVTNTVNTVTKPKLQNAKPQQKQQKHRTNSFHSILKQKKHTSTKTLRKTWIQLSRLINRNNVLAKLARINDPVGKKYDLGC